MTNNQQHKMNKRFISELFLSKMSGGKLKSELKSLIYETVVSRIENNVTQKEMAELKGISLTAVKQIENGQCYCVIKISKYTK